MCKVLTNIEKTLHLRKTKQHESTGAIYRRYTDKESIFDMLVSQPVATPIRIPASALFNGAFETVRHNMPKAAALTHMAVLREFYFAGWVKILGITGA